jgi:hypothetical protein
MCMCSYVCMYVRMHVCAYVCMYVFAYVHTSLPLADLILSCFWRTNISSIMASQADLSRFKAFSKLSSAKENRPCICMCVLQCVSCMCVLQCVCKCVLRYMLCIYMYVYVHSTVYIYIYIYIHTYIYLYICRLYVCSCQTRTPRFSSSL